MYKKTNTVENITSLDVSNKNELSPSIKFKPDILIENHSLVQTDMYKKTNTVENLTSLDVSHKNELSPSIKFKPDICIQNHSLVHASPTKDIINNIIKIQYQ